MSLCEHSVSLLVNGYHYICCSRKTNCDISLLLYTSSALTQLHMYLLAWLPQATTCSPLQQLRQKYTDSHIPDVFITPLPLILRYWHAGDIHPASVYCWSHCIIEQHGFCQNLYMDGMKAYGSSMSTDHIRPSATSVSMHRWCT